MGEAERKQHRLSAQLTQPEGIPVLIHQMKVKSLFGRDQSLSVKVSLNRPVGGVPREKEADQEREPQRNGRDQEAPVGACRGDDWLNVSFMVRNCFAHLGSSLKTGISRSSF